MKIALAQINPTVGDLKGNAERIIEQTRAAIAAGAAVVTFPELGICGYPPEDLVLKDYFVADCRETVLDIAAACPQGVVVVGLPIRENGAVFNAAAVLAGGRMAGLYRKIWLPNYAVFDEKRYFTPGERAAVLQMGEMRLGITICEDIWEENGPWSVATRGGAVDVVVNLSMSPYHLGKGRQREAMLSERACTARAYVCYVNGVGGQDELVFDGQSLVFDPRGGLVSRAVQFEEELLLVDVLPGSRGDAPATAHGSGLWPVETITVESAPSLEGAGSESFSAAPLHEPLSAEAEVYRALCLAVKDYAGKNGFRRVVMGISGGIDSALTACVAADALGADKVTAVSMPSRYSSAGTKSDARITAERLGVQYFELPIENVYASYLDSLAPYLDAASPGVTEQNIQARIRGNLLMALSNRFGWLVLTTGNKSETAVGYATLYGDMAGGFAVLKDVPKTLVYRLARYRNSLGPQSGPIPESTIERAPSAELAPGQTDQDTLPPYEVLDRIIDAYVVRDESLDEIVALGIDREVVKRVLALIDGNEYKRRQGAPGVRITPKAFGKDRRLPITNRYRG